jgi:hypothetical protein
MHTTVSHTAVVRNLRERIYGRRWLIGHMADPMAKRSLGRGGSVSG